MRGCALLVEGEQREMVSELETADQVPIQRKEALAARAEQLSHSQDWRPTARQFRKIAQEWQQVDPADRKGEDPLWNRFLAARQLFLDRQAHHIQESRQVFNAAIHAELCQRQEGAIRLQQCIQADFARVFELEERLAGPVEPLPDSERISLACEVGDLQRRISRNETRLREEERSLFGLANRTHGY